MNIRARIAFVAALGLMTASPVAAASGSELGAFTNGGADASSASAPDTKVRCDRKTGLDSSGAHCVDKVDDHSTSGSSATWLVAALGVAAVAGVVVALSQHNNSPASP